MELLVPSLFILLLAGIVVFFLVPRVSSFLIFVVTVIFLFLAVYSHYQMFSHEYKTNAWRDSIQAYAPIILIVAIVIGVLISFSNLFTSLREIDSR